jgi:hypothetical protein
MRTRKGYCPQQREERAQADHALCKKAGELLADPDAVAAMVTQLVTDSCSPKMLRYSIRNQALLISQADQRGMSLTDVDSFAGWKNRGRRVRKGEHGLRIVAPTGTKTGKDAEQDENISATDSHKSDDKQLPVRFHMAAVFDISQTEAIDDTEAVSQAEAEEVPNPAALLRDALSDQLQRRGYTIVVGETATGGTEIEHDTVRLPAGAELPELARTVAEVLTGTQPAHLAAS